MQQVFVIHGGSTFDSYEHYLTALKDIRVTLEDVKTRSWKSALPEILGEDFDVLTPHFPNRMNAKYAEWKIWFEKYIPLLDDNVIFVGHSLGAVFLVKYLSEEKYPKHIRATFLVATPFSSTEHESLADFILPQDIHGFEQQGGAIYLYHSTDDRVVPFGDLEKYRTRLPSAHVRVFEDRRHFNDEHFPELAADILDVAKK